VVALLVPAGAPVTVAIDDTLFRRRSQKVWAASWFHDRSGAGKDKTGYGNNWVIAGIIVAPPMISRPVCLPMLARLVIRGTNSRSRLWLAALARYPLQLDVGSISNSHRPSSDGTFRADTPEYNPNYAVDRG